MKHVTFIKMETEHAAVSRHVQTTGGASDECTQRTAHSGTLYCLVQLYYLFHENG